jgi:hypothetical protein
MGVKSTRHLSMRIPTVAPISNVRATPRALLFIEVINYWKRSGATFKQIAKFMNLSERTVRRYYWGIHSLNDTWGKGVREQIRIGACVTLY